MTNELLFVCVCVWPCLRTTKLLSLPPCINNKEHVYIYIYIYIGRRRERERMKERERERKREKQK